MSFYCMLPCTDFQEISSNIDASLDPAAWSAGTYLAEAQVSHGIYIYQALADTTAEPGNSPDWQKIGVTNQFGYQDAMIVTASTATAADNSIRLTVKGSADFLILLGVEADRVFISGVQVDMQVPVYDMWQYYSAPIEYNAEVSSEVLFREEIEVIIERDAAPAELGKLALCRSIWLGNQEFNPEIDFTDYSALVRDDFGYVIDLNQRGYAKNLYGVIDIATADAPALHNQLIALRSIPAVYIDKVLNIKAWGMLRQAKLNLPNGVKSKINYRIEGLI